jgi:hypothetical protein
MQMMLIFFTDRFTLLQRHAYRAATPASGASQFFAGSSAPSLDHDQNTLSGAP